MKELLIGLGIAVIAIFALLVWWRTKNAARGDVFTGNVDNATSPDAIDASFSALSQTGNDDAIGALIAAGKKIEAIKLIRERTGLGLKEAKDIADAMEDGKPVSLSPNSEPRQAIADLDTEVRSLIAKNRKIDAIKLVREQTGLGLKEAKDYVERLA